MRHPNLTASRERYASYYAAQYLRKHGLANEGTRVRVTAGKATGPARLDNFNIEVSLPVLVGDEHRTGVEAAVKRCLIHNTLLHPPKITIDIEGGALPTAA